jgi:hypothetical protein
MRIKDNSLPLLAVTFILIWLFAFMTGIEIEKRNQRSRVVRSVRDTMHIVGDADDCSDVIDVLVRACGRKP